MDGMSFSMFVPKYLVIKILLKGYTVTGEFNKIYKGVISKEAYGGMQPSWNIIYRVFPSF